MSYEASGEDWKAVNAALREAGYGKLRGLDKRLEAFVLDQTGATLTEMAASLGVQASAFYHIHNDWVERHAPGIFD